MKRQVTGGAADRQGHWAPEGAEANAVLELARSVEPRAPDSEVVSAQLFTASFSQYTSAKNKRPTWEGLGGWRYGFAFAAALVAALAFFKLGGLMQGRDVLSYHVKSGAPTGRFIEAKLEPIELDFSDGTVVVVERASKARVSETTRLGARFRLDSGSMAFNVVPNPNRGNWSVDAGPFQVRVTGTIFTVEWIAAEGSLRVDVTRGHVVVEGAGQRRELGPGDSFHHRESATLPSDAASGSDEEHGVEPRILEPSDLPAASGSAPRSGEKGGSWSLLVAAGEFATVLDAANRRGIQSCLDGCAQEDLRALADAARLTGKAALAERALLAQRSRFGGSADAAAAAFLLGRSAEERHDPKAVAWYDKYLAEAPKGRFAGDALGRKMMLLAGSNKTAAAALAEQYLARFAAGPYAGHARSLLEATSRGR